MIVDWEPHAEEFRLDPYPLYRQLRDEAPIYHNEERGFWAVTRYEDIRNLSRDPAHFCSGRGALVNDPVRESPTQMA